jgi:4-hydroxy-tetrahydrodipicolinate synthase
VKPKRPEFSFLTGWDVVLMPMLLMGCDGGTNATSGIVPELMRKLWDLVSANRLDEARALQMRILELFDAMLYSADFPEGFRAAVELRGFDFGKSRQPLSAAQSIDRVALQRVLHCILADFGVVDPPAEGCSSRTGHVEQDKILQVTHAVMASLKAKGIG